MSREEMQSEHEVVTKPEIEIALGGTVAIAKPTDNYRRVITHGRDVIQRCWIVGCELVWREIPVIDGEATDADRRD